MIKNYDFTSFDQDEEKKISDFDFGSFTDSEMKSKPSPAIIKKERAHEKSTPFQIDKIVRKLRGLEKQEEEDEKQTIDEKVKKEITQVVTREQQVAKEAGFEEGKKQAYEEYSKKLEEVFIGLNEEIVQIKSKLEDYLKDREVKITQTVLSLSKWVLLKEMQEPEYFSRLFEKLMLEVNERQNLLVKVNPSSYEKIKELIPEMEKKFGELKNIRVESDLSINDPGILIECENSLIDGSQERILQSLNEIFDEAVSDGSV